MALHGLGPSYLADNDMLVLLSNLGSQAFLWS